MLKILPLFALASSVTILLLVARTPQALYSDPAWQLKALQQYLAGEAKSFNNLAQPDPHDLSVNSSEWISWWPLGTNILVYPLLRARISMGLAVRCLAAFALVAGSVGFGYWLSFFRLPRWMAITLAVGIPWIRYANLGLFSYAAEALVYGIAPWIVLGVLQLRNRWICEPTKASPLLATGVGLLLGSAYWLKYSAVFTSLGAIVYLLATARTLRKRSGVTSDLVIVVSGFVALVAALNILNRTMGAAMNSVTQAFSVHFDWQLPANVVGLFAMAMADADGLWRYVLFHPGHAWVAFSYTYLCLIGLPGGLVLLWLLFRSSEEETFRLARYIFLTSVGAFVLVMIVFGARAYEARYVSAIGIVLIPVVIQSALQLWPQTSRLTRIVLILSGAFYIAVPTLYGATSVWGKVRRTPHYTSGPSHLYNPLLANNDAKTAVNNLLADFRPDTDVWYLTEPVSAMDLPGRAILRHSDFLSVEQLKRDNFRTNAPIRVRLLLPPSFEQNGKGQIIRDSFPQAQRWKTITVRDTNYVLWTAELK